MLKNHFSDTAATSQDGLSLEFALATAGKGFYIQDARCRGLWRCLSSFFLPLPTPVWLEWCAGGHIVSSKKFHRISSSHIRLFLMIIMMSLRRCVAKKKLFNRPLKK